MKTILALSPHPDDIELGAGGFLLKQIQENSRHVLAINNWLDYLLRDFSTNLMLLNQYLMFL